MPKSILFSPPQLLVSVGVSSDVSAVHPTVASTTAAAASTTPASPSDMTPEAKLGLIVDLMSDVTTIRASTAPLFDSRIWPHAHGAGGGDPAPFHAAIDAACANMKANLEPFVEFIIGEAAWDGICST